jgi:hypothetical protein
MVAETAARPSEATRELRERYTDLVRRDGGARPPFLQSLPPPDLPPLPSLLQDVSDRGARLREQLKRLRNPKE